MNQLELNSRFAEQNAYKFNPVVFTRSDEDILQEMQRAILSLERQSEYLTIKVKGFEVIDDYMQIMQILKDYEERILAKPSSKKKNNFSGNKYDYINRKDSDIRLLIVHYWIAAKDGEEDVPVLIALPRIVNKFYMRLNGMLYSAMYQIVDASTYNNRDKAENNKKKEKEGKKKVTNKNNRGSITIKAKQPIRIFRNLKDITTVYGDKISCYTYDNNTFTYSVPVAVYFFAKMGLVDGLLFMKIYSSIYFSKDYPEERNPEVYTFKAKKNDNVYVNVPCVLFDNDRVVQHAVYAILSVMKPDTTMDDLFTQKFWLYSLGAIFNNPLEPVEKGCNILSSLEYLYDLGTKEDLQLPLEYKKDIYDILRWVIWEYNAIRSKNNLNILTKKIVCGKYIAAKYATILAGKIYKLTDKSKIVTTKIIKKHLVTHPFELIKNISRDQLVTFAGMVTDLDSLLAMKYTYKGDTGINSLSSAYKLIHYSNLGVVDPDASSASDPGTSGSLCPLVSLYDGNCFSEYKETLSHETDYEKLYDFYKNTVGLKEVVDFKNKILHDKSIRREEIIETETSAQQLRNMVMGIIPEGMKQEEVFDGVPMEGSGTIIYE